MISSSGTCLAKKWFLLAWSLPSWHNTRKSHPTWAQSISSSSSWLSPLASSAIQSSQPSHRFKKNKKKKKKKKKRVEKKGAIVIGWPASHPNWIKYAATSPTDPQGKSSNWIQHATRGFSSHTAFQVFQLNSNCHEVLISFSTHCISSLWTSILCLCKFSNWI